MHIYVLIIRTGLVIDEENPYAGSKAEISFTCTYDHSTAAEEDQTQAATSTISKSVEVGLGLRK